MVAGDQDVISRLTDLSKGAAKKKVLRPQPKLDADRCAFHTFAGLINSLNYPEAWFIYFYWKASGSIFFLESLLFQFLANPVHMHGGLIRITFCLSVTGPNFRLYKKSLDQNSYWTTWKFTWFHTGQKSQDAKLWLQIIAWWQLAIGILEWNQVKSLAGVLSSTSSCIFFLGNLVFQFFSWIPPPLIVFYDSCT